MPAPTPEHYGQHYERRRWHANGDLRGPGNISQSTGVIGGGTGPLAVKNTGGVTKLLGTNTYTGGTASRVQGADQHGRSWGISRAAAH